MSLNLIPFDFYDIMVLKLLDASRKCQDQLWWLENWQYKHDGLLTYPPTRYRFRESRWLEYEMSDVGKQENFTLGRAGTHGHYVEESSTFHWNDLDSGVQVKIDPMAQVRIFKKEFPFQAEPRVYRFAPVVLSPSLFPGNPGNIQNYDVEVL
ncbi:hypothetical protein K435DRAFT_799888 [Dendrothele bispora CBS 962.96]|uniref:Uncharacterized protein n=1 Tax=Dendrothele bispora (strain CBS 962.96) TaxID=1314807 RepID=A0A4S8LUG3_DENBC|nr:hypothetical protein K435DRAFT_799888 [Dendrothele bispora CBS 962.96]